MSDDKKKYAKAGLGYTIGNVLVRGIGFLTIPIFARLMSTYDYGVYNTYASYEAILFIVMGLALNASFKNANQKFIGRFEEYVSTCAEVAIIVLIMFLIGAVLIFEIGGLSKPAYVYLLLLHGFASAIIAYLNAYLSISYRSRDYVKYALIIAVGNVLISVLLMLSVLSDNRGLARIIGVAIPNIFVATYIVSLFWKQARPKLRKEYISFIYKFSIPLIPHGISQVILSTFDRIMITNIVGEAETGIYSFSYNVYSIVSVIFSSLNQVFEPWFFERMRDKDYESIRKVSSKYMFGTLMLVSIVMLGSPELIKILGTSKYEASIDLITPVTVGGFFTYLYLFPALIEYYHEKTKYIAAASIASAVLNYVLNYIFINKYGYKAAAYTTLFTYFVYFIFHYCISRLIAKRAIYSFSSFAVIITLILAIGVFNQLFLGVWILRWTLLLVISVILAIFVFREIDIKSRIAAIRRKG